MFGDQRLSRVRWVLHDASLKKARMTFGVTRSFQLGRHRTRARKLRVEDDGVLVVQVRSECLRPRTFSHFIVERTGGQAH